MTGFQYLHLGTYSRKGNTVGRTVCDVLFEAARVPGNMNHVEYPQPPELLFGMNPLEALAFHDLSISEAKNGHGRGRSIRHDTHTLCAAVFSFPVPPSGRGVEAYMKMRDDSLAWFIGEMEKRGGQVLGAVQHVDERFLHVHAYTIATKNQRLNAKKLHPGHIAAETARADKTNPTVAFKAAMRVWQDSYQEVVGRHGLARIGPGRRRLSRSAWRIEQAEAERHAERLRNIEIAEKDIERAKSLEANAVRVPIAIATAIRAWCNNELDDNADINAAVPDDRRLVIVRTIEPARNLVRDMIQKISNLAASFDDVELANYRESLVNQSQEIISPRPMR